MSNDQTTKRKIPWKSIRIFILLCILVEALYLTNTVPLEVRISSPDPLVAQQSTLVEAVRPSTVRVLSKACSGGGLIDGNNISQGTGWVAGKNLVVTNAHVVAGGANVKIHQDSWGDVIRDGTVVLFDAKHDIAIIRASTKGMPILPLASGETKGPALLYGYPNMGPNQRSVQIGPTRLQLSRNIYGDITLKHIVFLRGAVSHGQSGSPIINKNRQVVATLNAGVVERATNTLLGYAVPNDIVAADLRKATNLTEPADAGKCVDLPA